MATRSAFPPGIDVSSHQGTVNWASVAASGKLFAATKLTGGAWYQNPTGPANWAGIKASGMTRIAYHYAFESSGQPLPGPGPEAEADYFCSTLEPLGVETGDILWLDIEEGPAGPLGDWALRWCQRTEARLGFRPMIYSGEWFTDAHQFALVPQLADYGLVLAAYQASMPSPPQPWPMVAIWQWTDRGVVPGVNGPCDLDVFNGPAENLKLYGKPDGAVPVPPPTSAYAYNARYPGITQDESFDCSETAALWSLRSWGVDVDEQWLEDTMIAEQVMSPSLGLLQADGSGLAAFLNRHWGPEFVATNDGEVSFDDVASEMTNPKYPTMLGGRTWGEGGHWTACRGYDSANQVLLLANPAPGYGEINYSLDRAQFADVGSFSLVRLRNPAAEGAPDQAPSYAPPGSVGSGLLELMAQAGTQPACPSTFLPLGASPAMIEQCVGLNGTIFMWHLPTGRHWTYAPDG